MSVVQAHLLPRRFYMIKSFLKKLTPRLKVFLPRSCIAVVCAEFESRLRLGNSLSRSVAQQVEQVRNAREMVDGKVSRWDSGQIASRELGRYGGLITIRKSVCQSAESK